MEVRVISELEAAYNLISPTNFTFSSAATPTVSSLSDTSFKVTGNALFTCNVSKAIVTLSF